MVARLTSIVIRYQKVAVSSTVTLIFFSLTVSSGDTLSLEVVGRPSNLNPLFIYFLLDHPTLISTSRLTHGHDGSVSRVY